MQKVSREQLIDKACELLASGAVSCVLGWGKGEFDYDVTPTLFKNAEELQAGFVFSDFCGANFSKYLVSKTQKIEGKVLVFLKPCDTYSFNQLLTEHRFDREKVYAVGIPCEGMADISKVKAIVGEGISSISSDGDKLLVATLYDDTPVSIDPKDVMAERCLSCKSRRHAVYDELIGEEGSDIPESGRFDLVAKLGVINEDSPEYRKMALTTLVDSLSHTNIIELNTGAISRGYRKIPYPAPFLLNEIKNHKANIILSSDSHSKDTLTFYFDESINLLRECGIKSVLTYKNGTFEEIGI